MKPIQQCFVNGKDLQVASLNLVLTLNGAGRGFITVVPEDTSKSLIGAVLSLNLGGNNETWRYFTGYVERDQPAENGARRLFIREAAAILDFDFPCAFQHPTLKTVLDNLSQQTGLDFVLPDADYVTRKIPHFTHAGSGEQLLNLLGRTFNIPDYVWHAMPDGTIYAGGAKDSRFAGLSLPDIPPQYIMKSHAGNGATIMILPTIRPGINLPAGRITRVAIDDQEMTLTWERLDADGKPLSKSPLRRQIEGQFPELADGTLKPRLARVISPGENSALGDAADPFRPKYAVDVQLLDENGSGKSGTPVYKAVPLPVPMAGPEAGMFSYPPSGTLVEVASIEGRPDKPIIRQILPEGLSLPAIEPGEQLQQQRAEVFKRITKDGSMLRETDQAITEKSASRNITNDSEERTTTTRTTTVQATDSTTVLGTASLMAGHAVQLADGDYSIGAGNNLLLKARAIITKAESLQLTLNGNLQERIVGSRTCQAGQQLSFVAPQVYLGSGGTKKTQGLNVLNLMLETLELVKQLAQHTANHTHSNTGAPTNNGELASDAAQAAQLKTKYQGIIA